MKSACRRNADLRLQIANGGSWPDADKASRALNVRYLGFSRHGPSVALRLRS